MKIESFMFADDVRLEVTGKPIIIGVYDFSILLPPQGQFPVTMPLLSFYCRFLMEKGESAFDEIEFRYLLNSEEIVKARAKLQVRDYALPITVYNRVPDVILKAAGKLEFEMNLSLKGKLVLSSKPGFVTVAVAGSVTKTAAI